jgi:cystathionine beta-lyase/cystathionine gamma-synthase
MPGFTAQEGALETNGEGIGTGARLAAETLAVHTWTGRGRAHRTLNAPLYQSSQWEAASLEELAGLFAGDPDRGFYLRFGHPTIRLAEEKLSVLEGAEDALLFSSGMGAISSSLLAVLRSGDHVVAHRSIFGQTIRLLEHLAQAFGVRVDFVDAASPAEVEAAVTPATRLLYLETPSNPLIDVLDIQALAAIAHRNGALVFVDSTFAGPLVQRPLELGADLSLQSASKSLAGHADLLAGSVAGGRALVARIREMRVMGGPSLDPHACWLLLRGMQTLPLRVRAQSETAFALARMLEASPEVETIRYPFLDSHPACEVARRQMKLGGGMISFSLRGGIESTRRFVAALEWIPIASSLGSVYTTVEVPEELDFSVDELGDRAASFAMPAGLVRFSVGVEAAADIEAEVRRGLDAAAAGRGSTSGARAPRRHLAAVAP